MNEVYVKVVGKQTHTDGETEEVVSDVRAEATSRGDKHYIRYHDALLIEGGSVHTTLKIADDALTVMHRGDIETTIHYAAGRSQEVCYYTSHGLLPMRHDTKSIVVDYDGEEGTIDIVYDSYMDGSYLGERELHIEVKRRA